MSGKNEAPPIGIDLGTTYSVVAVFRRNKAEALANDEGSRTTPSVVGFFEDDLVVGQAAKDLPPVKRIYDAKRMVGRPIHDEDLQRDIPLWPFTVTEKKGMPMIQVQLRQKTKTFAPEEISGMVLSELKKVAEGFLETPVTKAVITVPAYFNESMRQATMVAGKFAGLDVIGMINEPTAAAIAYGFDKASLEKTLFVYDLGGGTFDVSIVRTDGRNMKVLATLGDTHLGGQDFDLKIMEHLARDIQAKHKVIVGDDLATQEELRNKCEVAKRSLSKSSEVQIEVLLHSIDKGYKSKITRATFESLCEDLFNKTIDISRNAILEADLTCDEIDEVLLVGGSTRIPKVRSLVRELFKGKEPVKGVNADEVVAVGAALHAANLCNIRGATEINLKEVTPLSLGIATSNGLMVKLLPRNTPLPASASKIFTTADDDQEEAEFKICQGERARWMDNSLLGTLRLPIPPCAKGEVDLKTTFKMDENGLLTVSAQDMSTKEQVQTRLESSGRLTEEQIAEICERALKFKEEDEEVRRSVKKSHPR